MPSVFSGPQKSLWCAYCNRLTLHESDIHVLGAGLMLITCCLALPFIVLAWPFMRHYACQVCGTKRRGS